MSQSYPELQNIECPYEIKLDIDVSQKNYFCEIDPCMEKAVAEVKVGHYLDHPGHTYLVCPLHKENIIEIYLEEIS